MEEIVINITEEPIIISVTVVETTSEDIVSVSVLTENVIINITEEPVIVSVTVTENESVVALLVSETIVTKQIIEAVLSGNITSHTHSVYILHSLATAINDFIVATGNGVFVKKTLEETKIILGVGGGGEGDVKGPSTNTDGYIPLWNGVDSKTLKNGLPVPSGGLAGLTDLGNKVDKVSGKGLSTNDYTTAEQLKVSNLSGSNTGDETGESIKTKLGVTVLSGSNTGDQDISVKVDKVEGKGLSVNDLTDALKSAYDGTVSWISVNGANLLALVGFPGFGTSHNTAAYGDHTHPADSNKVDKVSGKGLSTNDLTDALKQSYDGAVSGLSSKADLVGGLVPEVQLPAFVIALLTCALIAPAGSEGKLYYNTSTKKIYTYHNSTWGNAVDPESIKIYLAVDTYITYWWDSVNLVSIGSSLALGETSTTAGRGDHTKTAYDHSQIGSGNPHGTGKEDIAGIRVADSPENANVLITSLASASGIPAVEYTWLNSIQALTTKSVLAFLASIVHYLYTVKDVITYSTNRVGATLTNGVIYLDRDCTQYNSYTMVGALQLTVDSSAVVGGFAEGIIVGDGVNTPTLSGITLWPESLPYDSTAAKQNKFMIVKFGGGVYIKWTQMN